MPKGKPIPQKVKERIYNAYTLGESSGEISDRMGLSVVTVRRIVREQRKAYEKAREDMARSGKIVKKDGKGGKLMALSPEGFEFTHVTPDGKSHKKKVGGHIARVAERQYDAWCQELDDEVTFMDMVERKTEPSVAEVEDAPVSELLEEPFEEPLDDVAPVEEPVVEQTETRPTEQAFSAVYVIWAKSPMPRLYGAYRSLEAALARLDELNEVATFLGQSEVFEAEEVSIVG